MVARTIREGGGGGGEGCIVFSQGPILIDCIITCMEQSQKFIY